MRSSSAVFPARPLLALSIPSAVPLEKFSGGWYPSHQVSAVGGIEREETMTKEELLKILSSPPCVQWKGEDLEAGHVVADDALLKYIDDPEITAAFEAVPKWYA